MYCNLLYVLVVGYTMLSYYIQHVLCSAIHHVYLHMYTSIHILFYIVLEFFDLLMY